VTYGYASHSASIVQTFSLVRSFPRGDLEAAGKCPYGRCRAAVTNLQRLAVVTFRITQLAANASNTEEAHDTEKVLQLSKKVNRKVSKPPTRHERRQGVVVGNVGGPSAAACSPTPPPKNNSRGRPIKSLKSSGERVCRIGQ
jgi:hypothetical protein